MTTKIEEILKKSIRYRVEQEYKKYHNDTSFKYNGKDFWIEQIVWKLAETITDQLTTYIDSLIAEELESIKEIYSSTDKAHARMGANTDFDLYHKIIEQRIKQLKKGE